MSAIRHFLDLSDVEPIELRRIIDYSRATKERRSNWLRGRVDEGAPLAGVLLALMFEKPSTRTRVSFDAAIRQLGGESLVLSTAEMQVGRGETMADTARVLSRYVDCIMIRTWGHDRLHELAEAATVPVINGLTDHSHPCQVMADVLTVEEKLGPIGGKTVTWCGDCCNVTNSWIHAAARFGFSLRIAAPRELRPGEDVIAWAKRQKADVTFFDDPKQGVEGAHCIVTDTWFSMNETRSAEKEALLAPYQVNADLMARAAPDAIFLHCLPAHRDEEVTGDVMDGPQSVVFDEAENRLHAQKGILAWCFDRIA
ncbi:MAG: ornithine carbamoyltransferase [Hyphomicrobiales bacterium]